jgi:hypothetical protein
MKKHGSYKRLIAFNKTVILLSAIIVIIALFSIFFIDAKGKETLFARITGSINFFLFVWTIINTFIFVRLFYKLITH